MLGVDSCSLTNPSGPLAADTRYDGTVEAIIVNEGSERREGEVVASIGGVSLGGEGVELPPGESTTLAFNADFRTPRVSPGETTQIEHGAEVVDQSIIETGGDGGGDGGGGGGGGDGSGGIIDRGTDNEEEASLSDVSFQSVSIDQDRVLAGNTNSVSAVLRNSGAQSVDAGLEADGSESIRQIPPGGTQSVSLSIGPFVSPGQESVTVRLTDGQRTSSARQVSFEVEQDFTDPDPNPGSGSGGGGGGGGGGGDDGSSGGDSGRCDSDERYSSSIGECIPDCPQGQAFFPGSGCLAVTSLGEDPETGEESPELKGLYGGARRAVIYRGRGKKKP